MLNETFKNKTIITMLLKARCLVVIFTGSMIVQISSEGSTKLKDVMKNSNKFNNNNKTQEQKNDDGEEDILKVEIGKVLGRCTSGSSEDIDNDSQRNNNRHGSSGRRNQNNQDNYRRSGYDNDSDRGRNNNRDQDNGRYGKNNNNRNPYKNYEVDSYNADQNSKYGSSNRDYSRNNGYYGSNDDQEGDYNGNHRNKDNGFYSSSNDQQGEYAHNRRNNNGIYGNSNGQQGGYENTENRYNNPYIGYNSRRQDNFNYKGNSNKEDCDPTGHDQLFFDNTGHLGNSRGYSNRQDNNNEKQEGYDNFGYKGTYSNSNYRPRIKRSSNKREDENQCTSQCVFGHMEMLDDDQIPSETLFVKWVQEHIKHDDMKRIQTLREVRKCFARLSTSDVDDGCDFSKELAKCLNLDLA